MATVEMLDSIHKKLVRVNAALGTATLANLVADIAAISTLNTTMETRLGTTANTSTAADLQLVQDQLDLTPSS